LRGLSHLAAKPLDPLSVTNLHFVTHFVPAFLGNLVRVDRTWQFLSDFKKAEE